MRSCGAKKNLAMGKITILPIRHSASENHAVSAVVVRSR